MVVLKFGGTSVMDAICMDQSLDITFKYLDQAPLLVSSAMSKVTDGLIEIGDTAARGEAEKAAELVEKIMARHFGVAADFLTGKNLEEANDRLNKLGTELKSLVSGLATMREDSLRSRDSLLAFGELMSTSILSCRANERGVHATFIDAREFVKTDSNFSSAYPDFEATNALIKKGVHTKKGCLSVTQGFIGSNEEGITTTLGRGGSDYSAAIFGAALDAEEIQIWTDVNGIMTTDPRIVPGAITIDKITYAEAAEAAYFGAKVVHPATIQPAVTKKIPVLVLNTKNAAGKKTIICDETPTKGLKAIAGKKNITVITIESSRMHNAYGFLTRIFTIFEKFKTSIDLITTSEVSVSMTIDNNRYLNEITEELKNLGKVTVETNNAILCMVGQELWKNSTFISRALNTISDISIRLISLGSSDTNLSIVIPQDKLEHAIKTLHKEFFGV